jgi:hypothetical protein
LSELWNNRPFFYLSNTAGLILANFIAKYRISMVNFFKKLFKSQTVRKANIPFLHEAIDLKNYPLAEFLLWQKEEKWKALIELIDRAFSDKLITGKSVTESISIMNSTYANGWLVHCGEQDFNDTDYKHFAYLLYNKVKSLDYTLNLAEVRSQERTPNIETITKYYLKPSLRNRFISDNDLANQLYGNITISYKCVNGRPFEFKFEAHAYLDSNYTVPLDFANLKDLVLV